MGGDSSAIEFVSFFQSVGSVMDCQGGVNADVTATVSCAATI